MPILLSLRPVQSLMKWPYDCLTDQFIFLKTGFILYTPMAIWLSHRLVLLQSGLIMRVWVLQSWLIYKIILQSRLIRDFITKLAYEYMLQSQLIYGIVVLSQLIYRSLYYKVTLYIYGFVLQGQLTYGIPLQSWLDF